MSGNPYLFAAYAVTWLIHITYLGTIVRRYRHLKREIEQLRRSGLKS
jgi:CcmD family protein